MKSIVIDSTNKNTFSEALVSLGFIIDSSIQPTSITIPVIALRYRDCPLCLIIEPYNSTSIGITKIHLYDIESDSILAYHYAYIGIGGERSVIFYETPKNGGIIMGLTKGEATKTIPCVNLGFIQPKAANDKWITFFYATGSYVWLDKSKFNLSGCLYQGVLDTEIQFVKAVDVVNKRTLDNFYLSTTNPFEAIFGANNAYRYFYNDGKKYMVFPITNGSSYTKAVIEITE